tara:strand:+ start:789 stop:1013 length:225 start_codon:yes stop_codon:yes gene_type:complete
MPHLIRYYNREDDSLIGDLSLPEMPIGQLQAIFQVDNPMYDCYEIKDEHISFFGKYIDYDFRLKKYDYFLEFDE